MSAPAESDIQQRGYSHSAQSAVGSTLRSIVQPRCQAEQGINGVPWIPVAQLQRGQAWMDESTPPPCGKESAQQADTQRQADPEELSRIQAHGLQQAMGAICGPLHPSLSPAPYPPPATLVMNT